MTLSFYTKEMTGKDTPSADTPDEKEAPKNPEHIAGEKLERLLAAENTGFAVRFMNMGEYEKLLGDQYRGLRETNGFFVPFKEWFHEQKNDWRDAIAGMTDWTESLQGNDTRNQMLALLSRSKSNVTKRTALLRDFQYRLLSVIQRDMPTGNGGSKVDGIYGRDLPYGTLTDIFLRKAARKLDTKSLDDLRKAYTGPDAEWKLNEETIVAIHTFINDPAKMTKKQLRDLFDELSERRGGLSVLGTQTHNYQVGVVFAPQAIEDYYGKNSQLETLKMAEKTRYWPKGVDGAENHILCAIVPFNDRTLVEKTVRLSAASGARAHPVIDAKGFVRFPAHAEHAKCIVNGLDQWLDAEKKKEPSKQVLTRYWCGRLGLSDERHYAAFCGLLDHTFGDLGDPLFRIYWQKHLNEKVQCDQWEQDVLNAFLAFYTKRQCEELGLTQDPDNLDYVRWLIENFHQYRPDWEKTDGMFTIGNISVPAKVIREWNPADPWLADVRSNQPQFFETLEKIRFYYVKKQKTNERENAIYHGPTVGLMLLLEADAEALRAQGEDGVKAAAYLGH